MHWLPPGLLAADPAALHHIHALGRLREPATSPPPQLAAATTVKEYMDEMLGLRVYPALGIAVQPVSGVIAAGCGLVAEYYGMFDLTRIVKSARAVVADPSISAFILDMDTPGGYTSGVAEAAAAVLAMPLQRPGLATISYSQRLCCSAGEWLAASTGVSVSAGSATRGSVGVISSIVDSTAYYRAMGLDKTVFTDGEYKGLGMPGVPVTDAQKAFLQSQVNTVSAAFKGFMSARRGLPPEAMQGQTYQASQAPAGLLDSDTITDLEELMAAIVAARS